jgi:hypothetical protein
LWKNSERPVALKGLGFSRAVKPTKAPRLYLLLSVAKLPQRLFIDLRMRLRARLGGLTFAGSTRPTREGAETPGQ